MKITDILTSSHSTLDIQQFLEKSDPDELFTVQELADKFGIPESTIKSSRLLAPNRIKYDGRNYFGNILAVSEFNNKVN